MTVVAGEFADETVPHNARAILRVDDEYLARKIDFVGGDLMGGDFMRAVIWYTLWSLNIRQLTRSGGTLQYAALHDVPPDEFRTPLSVQHLARALRLPYETVRRQVLALERDGLCVRLAGKGVIAPKAALERPELFESLRQLLAAMQRFIADLNRAGFDFAQLGRAQRPTAPDQASVIRAALRIDTEYTLGLIDMLRGGHNDDIVEALIFLSIGSENARRGAATETSDGRPVSVLAASESLKIPYETLRRTFNRMAHTGRLKRVKEGYVVPAELRRQIEDDAFVSRRYARLKRFLADLQVVGIAMPH